MSEPHPFTSPNGGGTTAANEDAAKVRGDEFWDWYDRLPAKLSRLRPFSEVEDRNTDWLWPGWIPKGGLTALGGMEKAGKSLLTVNLSASLSRQGIKTLGAWSEDPPEAVKRRLRASEAMLDNVFEVRREDFLLPSHLNELEMMVMESGAELIVLDHWLKFLDDDIQPQRANQVDRALRPLDAIARRHNIAIVLVCHLNRDREASRVYRIPVGLSGIARSLMMLTKQGDVAKLEHIGCNYGPNQTDRLYRYEENRLVSINEPRQVVWDYTYDD